MMPCNDLPYDEHGCLQPASSRCGLLLGWGTCDTPLLPQTPAGAMGMVGTAGRAYGELQPWEPSPHPRPPPLLPACLAVFSTSPPPHHWPPKPLSTRSLLYHRGKPFCPTASLTPCPLWGCLSSLGACGHGPAASRLPQGGLACPHPQAAQVSGHRRGAAHHLTPSSRFPQTGRQVNEPSGL